MVDHGAMRRWLKQHGSDAMLVTRRYQAKVDETEQPVLEYRLLFLRGEMDYTTAAHETIEAFQQDHDAALKRVLDHIAWQSKRDTGAVFDMAQALSNGEQYQKENP